jgi:hypothetical protein
MFSAFASRELGFGLELSAEELVIRRLTLILKPQWKY